MNCVFKVNRFYFKNIAKHRSPDFLVNGWYIICNFMGCIIILVYIEKARANTTIKPTIFNNLIDSLYFLLRNILK